MREFPSRRLDEVAELIMGQSPPGESYNTDRVGLPFIQGSAEFGARYPTPEKWCSDPRKVAEAGDLLMSVRAPVGDLNFADERIAIGRGLAIIRGTDSTTASFLALALEHAVDELQRNSSTGMFASITKKSLAGCRVPVPPLVVQRRIVDLIDHIDAVRTQLTHAVESSECSRQELRETVLRQFWQPPFLRPLGDVARIVSSLVDPTDATYANLDHLGIDAIESRTGRLLTMESVEASGVTSGKFAYESGQVIYAKIRPELRKATITKRPGLASADSYPLTPTHDLLPAYLFEVLLSENFTSEAVSRSSRTKMPKINRRDLFSIEVPVPPRQEQEVMASSLEGLRIKTEAARKTSDRIEALRAQVLTSLLSGEHEIPDSYDRFLDAVDDGQVA